MSPAFALLKVGNEMSPAYALLKVGNEMSPAYALIRVQARRLGIASDYPKSILSALNYHLGNL